MLSLTALDIHSISPSWSIIKLSIVYTNTPPDSISRSLYCVENVSTSFIFQNKKEKTLLAMWNSKCGSYAFRNFSCLEYSYILYTLNILYISAI